jgi:hypothetical protein
LFFPDLNLADPSRQVSTGTGVPKTVFLGKTKPCSPDLAHPSLPVPREATCRGGGINSTSRGGAGLARRERRETPPPWEVVRAHVTCNENAFVRCDSSHSFHQSQRRILRAGYEDVSSRDGSRCHTQSPLPEGVTNKTQERASSVLDGVTNKTQGTEVRLSLSLFRFTI